MKKIFTLASAMLMLAMSACADKTGYVVTGSAEGTVDGDTVYICDMQGFFAIVPTDTAVVKNGKFEFHGDFEGAAIRFLVPTHKGTAEGLGMADFVLENANINIQTFLQKSGKQPVIESDGKNAAIYKDYEALDKKWNDQINPYWDIVREKKGTEAEIAKAQAEMDKLGEQRDAEEYAFLKNHIPSGISDMLMAYNWSKYTDEQKAELMALFAEKGPEMPNYKKFVAQKKAEESTGIGSQYTDIVMQTPEGKTIKVSDYVSKNKYTLIDFWASWCGPCLCEMPNVVKAYTNYHDKGLEIVGVSLDNKKDAWVNAIKKQNMPWPHMSDLKGWECAGAAAYNVKAIPANVLISQDGKIIAKDLREEALQEKLAELLK